MQVSSGREGKFWLQDTTAGGKGPGALMGEVLNVNTFIYFCTELGEEGRAPITAAFTCSRRQAANKTLAILIYPPH